MRPEERAGSRWRDALNPLSLPFEESLFDRYGAALDRLVDDVLPELWDCPGGPWVSPSGDPFQRALSLWWLSKHLIDACETARKSSRSRRDMADRKRREQMDARTAKSAAGAARRLAEMLSEWAYEVRPALAATRPWLSPVDASPPQSLTPQQAESWRSMRRMRPVSATELASALEAFATELVKPKPKRPAGGHIGGPEIETALARDLSGWIRAATGAPYSWIASESLPTKGGIPAMEPVTMLVNAALNTSIPKEILRHRLSAAAR